MIPLAKRIVNRKLSVRGAEAAVRRENDEAAQAEEDEPTGVQVDYYAQVERKILDASGIRVRLRKVRGGRSRMEIDCENNDDLQEIIKKLCGNAYVED